jgi:hypothetical protein
MENRIPQVPMGNDVPPVPMKNRVPRLYRGLRMKQLPKLNSILRLYIVLKRYLIGVMMMTCQWWDPIHHNCKWCLLALPPTIHRRHRMSESSMPPHRLKRLPHHKLRWYNLSQVMSRHPLLIFQGPRLKED